MVSAVEDVGLNPASNKISPFSKYLLMHTFSNYTYNHDKFIAMLYNNYELDRHMACMHMDRPIGCMIDCMSSLNSL